MEFLKRVLFLYNQKTDVMLNKSTIKPNDKKKVLSKFIQEINNLIEYDKKEHRAVSILENIESRK